MLKRNTLPKKEHLCGDIRIGNLFKDGNAFISYPFRVVYSMKESEINEPLQVLFSVPKKRFKRAVKRNRIKRLMRESYRIHKHALQEMCIENKIEMHIAFTFVSDTLPEWDFIDAKMQGTLNRVETKLQKTLFPDTQEQHTANLVSEK